MRKGPVNYARVGCLRPRFLLPALLIETSLITGLFLMESHPNPSPQLRLRLEAQSEVAEEAQLETDNIFEDNVLEDNVLEEREAYALVHATESLSPPSLDDPLLPLPEHVFEREEPFDEKLTRATDDAHSDHGWLEPLRKRKNRWEAKPKQVVPKRELPRESRLIIVEGFNEWPLYPPRALELGHEGKLRFKLHVDNKGRVTKVELLSSTCSRLLERSASKALEKWRFIGGPGQFVQDVLFRLSAHSVGGG